MKKHLIASMPIALLLLGSQATAQAPDPAGQVQEPKPRPVVRLSFTERIKQYLQRTGATIDEAKSSSEMVVTNYPDPKGGKITVVIVNDRRKNLLGFYIYNFGNVKNVTNKEDVYKYLLSTNDAITIGSFFVDGEEDIGYKYMVSSVPAMTQATFETTYATMAAVARERKTEIRQLLAGSKDEKSPEVKKAAEEKPPEGN
ncbi:MAG TPA: hypothetical protein VFB82_19180 [Blastocatellia bacterium]|nr:hypothetical protein [Blastocatellia bacterium]